MHHPATGPGAKLFGYALVVMCFLALGLRLLGLNKDIILDDDA